MTAHELEKMAKDNSNARELARLRTILAAAVPQPESVECPAKCVGGRVPSPIKTEPWSNCKSCSGTGRIPAPERTVVEMAEAVVALSLESENIGWQRAHDPATCGHPRACWQDKNWPESEKNYNPETFSSDPPMEYRCLMCELTAERDRLAARVKTFESSDLAKLLQDREKEWQVAADKGVAETVERCAKIADKWDTFIGDAIRATAPKEPTAAEPRGGPMKARIMLVYSEDGRIPIKCVGPFNSLRELVDCVEGTGRGYQEYELLSPAEFRDLYLPRDEQ